MSMACPNGGVVDFTRSPRRGAMTAVCAKGTAGVDVKWSVWVWDGVADAAPS
jgi:hypothetical protein